MARRYRAGLDDSKEFSRNVTRPGLFGLWTWLAFSFFVLAICAAIVTQVIPQYQKLQGIEAELAEVEAQEENLAKKAQQLRAEAEALRTNPAYLEARARDPLRAHLPGEVVIQLED